MHNEGKHADDSKVYMAIDLKSFYASAECAARGLDPFTDNLVVADPDRSKNTICLAITPAMKALGIKNRCRIRDIPKSVSYVVAKPRMRYYLEVSARIYSIYLDFFSAQDTWVYSVDELFIDVTPYRALYGSDYVALAKRVTGEVFRQTGITATAGIGTNMFLCKVALDIMAKHAPDGIGILNRQSFFRDIWFHHPITDIWGIGPGTARRLAKHDVYDLAGICAMDPAIIRGEFGKNGQYLLDHAWGLEPCTIADCRSYVPKAHSLSNGQVLMRDYGAGEARTVLREMAWQSVLDMREKHLRCGIVGIWVGFSGWDGMPGLSRQCKLGHKSASEREIVRAVLSLYDGAVYLDLPIRRLGVCLADLVPEEKAAPTLFDDPEQEEDEARLAASVLKARRRFGTNAVITGTNLKPEATGRIRNTQIGGHHA